VRPLQLRSGQALRAGLHLSILWVVPSDDSTPACGSKVRSFGATYAARLKPCPDTWRGSSGEGFCITRSLWMASLMRG
jgi:hypothetical protein